MALVALVARASLAACVGDCNEDGGVTVDEILFGVNAALGLASVNDCPAFDRDQNGTVTIDELLEAMTNGLLGCPSLPTATPSQEATASPTARLPLLTPTPFVYRGFVGHPIDLPINGMSSDGGALTYSVLDLPAGASLDASSGELSWTPEADQIGTFYVPWRVQDDGMPSLAAEGRLTFLIEPVDDCATVDCDPAVGCTATLQPVTVNCCQGAAPIHLAEPQADCPAGRAILVGANANGVGDLGNCDLLHVTNFGQTGAEVLLNVAVRCVNASARVRIRGRLDMNRPDGGPTALFDDSFRVDLADNGDGFEIRRNTRFTVTAASPFFDLQDAEANLYVELTDADQNVISDSVRVRLTFTPVPDLIDPSPLPTPTPSFGGE